MLTSSTAATAQAGQRRISQAASTATAIHIAWKYLFMSKPMALTWTTLGTTNRATSQTARKPRCGTRGRSSASSASTNGSPRFVK